jgi:general secretion pathway protein J
MKHGIRASGFTLIELLVALMIFAVLSVMAYGGLNLVLDARERMDARTNLLAELQMSFTLIGRDIEQAINRPIRDEFGDPMGAMVGSAGLMEFTRAGWRNPAGLPRSELQRVSYMLDGDELKRISWPTLERTQASGQSETLLLGDVAGFEFRFLTQDGGWLLFWPPAGDGQQAAAALPRAVEISLETGHWGRVTRLFRTPGVVDIVPVAPDPGGQPTQPEEPSA